MELEAMDFDVTVDECAPWKRRRTTGLGAKLRTTCT